MEYVHLITYFPDDHVARYRGTIHRSEDGAKLAAQQWLDANHAGCGWEKARWRNMPDEDTHQLLTDHGNWAFALAQVQRIPVFD